MSLTLEQARAYPKVLLHDHLDGGLRPSTILELAATVGHELPSTDVDELIAYFRRGAESRDILQYLETFGHIVPLLQSAANLRRVAYEAALDLAADGVMYAEVRFAPELHTGTPEAPLSLDDAIRAVTDGFADGVQAAANPDAANPLRSSADVATADPDELKALLDRASSSIEILSSQLVTTGPIRINTIVCAMRTGNRAEEVAEAVARWQGRGVDGFGQVVSFDLAGAETGYPPTEHRAAVDTARAALSRMTVHASEAPGLELIAQALEVGAERIGHGVRLIEDCGVTADGLVLGPLARHIRDRRIPLELCPSCNVQIGAVPTLADHPIAAFLRAGFVATINTDNRLMSGVSASSELAAVANTFDLNGAEVRQLVLNGIEASFTSHDNKQLLRTRLQAVS